MTRAALTIDVNARLAGIEQGLKQVERDARQSADSLAALGSSIGTAFAGAATALAGIGLSRFLTDAVAEMAKLDDAAAIAGDSVENLSAVFNTLKPTGVTIDQLTELTTKLVRSMNSADEETSTASKAFEQLGIKTRDAAGNLRAPTVVLQELAKELDGYADSANKTAKLQEILGKSGAQYAPILKDLAQNTLELGTVTTDAAKAAADFEDNTRRLRKQLEDVAIDIATDTVPAINKLTEEFLRGRKAGLDWGQAIGVALGFKDGSTEKDLASLDASIARVNKKLGEFDDLRKSSPTTFKINERIFGDEASLKGSLEELKRQRDAIKFVLDEREKLAQRGDPRLFGMPALPKPDAPGSAAARDKPAARGQTPAEKLEADAKNFIETLKRQNALFGEQSELQKVTYEIEEGRFKALAPLLKGRIKDQAALLDQSRSQAKATEQNNKEAEQERELWESGARAIVTYNTKLEQQAQEFRDLIDPLDKYTRQIERVRFLVSEGKLTKDQGLELEFKIENSREDDLRKLGAATQQTTDYARQLGLTFSSAFEDAVVGGKKASDVLKGLAADIARIVIRQSVTKPLADSISGLFSSGGGLFSALGSLFGGGSSFVGPPVPGRATGGPVAAGMPYMVGERGPELFVPATAGTVKTNGSSGLTMITNVAPGVSPGELIAAMNSTRAQTIRDMQDMQRRGRAV